MSAAEHTGRRSFGDYEILAALGRGGVGETYAARATRGPLRGREVCLKIMGRQYQSPGDDGHDLRAAIIDSMRHEGHVVAGLKHPHIAQLLDSGAYNDVWFLVFELVRGASLWELLAMQGRAGLPADHVLHIGMQVSDALAHAHAHDVLHRDIKPGNILVGNDGVVKLVDFGLAKVGAASATRFTHHIGTPRYWSPEQVQGEQLSPAADVFALGLVLFECATGTHPFYDPDMAVFQDNVLRGRFRVDMVACGVSTDLASILRLCLQVLPSRRFASGRALHHAFATADRALDGAGGIGALAEAGGARRGRQLRDDADDDEGWEGDDSEVELAPTRVAAIHHQATRAASAQRLAAITGDALPGATEPAQREAIMADLRRMAREAVAARGSQRGRT